MYIYAIYIYICVCLHAQDAGLARRAARAPGAIVALNNNDKICNNNKHSKLNAMNSNNSNTRKLQD